MVFVIVSGEMGPYLGVLFALIAGAFVGFIDGIFVTRLGLSSFVSTIGMRFLIRGLIHIGTQGEGTQVTYLSGTPFYNAFLGSIWGFPVNMLWGLGFVVVSVLLFSYHRFGAQISCIGDSPKSSREMGINVSTIKTLAFMYMGMSSAIVAVLFTLTNQTFSPGTGEGILLVVLAAVFIGGTPGWGGIGTIMGAAIGACIVKLIESGTVAIGVSYLYKQFFYGLIIILALIGHKVNEKRYRY